MIYPAVHYTMGGLWVDYQLQSSLDGLFVIGEANFSDHGANRLGASALMQGLADGYFILPATLGNYLAKAGADRPAVESPAFAATEEEVTARIARLLRNRDWKSLVLSRWIIITASLVCCFGITAAWPVMRKG